MNGVWVRESTIITGACFKGRLITRLWTREHFSFRCIAVLDKGSVRYDTPGVRQTLLFEMGYFGVQDGTGSRRLVSSPLFFGNGTLYTDIYR